MSVSRLVFILRCYQKSNWSNVWHSSSSVSLSRESCFFGLDLGQYLSDNYPWRPGSWWIVLFIVIWRIIKVAGSQALTPTKEDSCWKKSFSKTRLFFSHCFCGTFWSSVAWGLDCPWVVRLWWGDADGCLTNRSVVLWIINPTDLRANGS